MSGEVALDTSIAIQFLNGEAAIAEYGVGKFTDAGDRSL